MKKVICVILLCVLCACSGERAVSAQMRSISFTAAISFEEELFECDVTVDKNGDCSMKLRTPTELTGLEFKCTATEFTASFLGLTYSPRIEDLPSGAVVKILYELISDAALTKRLPESRDGNYLLCGSTELYGYSLTLAPSGLPICAEIPDIGMKIDFKNVTVLK